MGHKPSLGAILRSPAKRPAVATMAGTLLVVPLLFSLFSATAHASSPPAEYELDWGVPGEVLAYRSCGCADSCWVAEVRSAHRKIAKYRLRCDCEKLYFSTPHKRTGERMVSDSCSRINDSDDKPDLIRTEMERLQRSTIPKRQQ